MLVAATDNVVLQQAFDLADPVKIFPAYPGKVDSPFCTQSLQSTATDFQEGTYFVTVHPTVEGFFLRLALQCGDKFDNRVDFRL